MSYKQYKVKTKEITTVMDKDKATNFGTIAVDGNIAYCIKTNATNTKSILFQFPNYTSGKNCQTATFNNKMNHANGMTFHNESLWIATQSSDIIRIKPNESLGKPYTFTPAKGVPQHNISGITYYKDNAFIVRTGKDTYIKKDKNNKIIENVPCLLYSIITFSGSTKTYSYKEYKSIKIMNVKDKNDYIKPQDICYHSGKLYVIVSKENLKENAILVIDLSKDDYDADKEGTFYKPSEILILNQSNYKKYEIESLDFVNEKMIFASNIIQSNKQDSILMENGKTEIK